MDIWLIKTLTEESESGSGASGVKSYNTNNKQFT